MSTSINSGYNNSSYSINQNYLFEKYHSSFQENDDINWEKVNFNLKVNGFFELTLKFDENENLHFDKVDSMNLLHLLYELLNENIKKNSLIKDSISTIEALKSQLKDNSFIIKRYEEMIKNLNDSLLDIKQQLKEKNIYSSNRYSDDVSQQMNNNIMEESRQLVVRRYHGLEQICKDQREEINLLQLKINKLNALEKSRNQRQLEIFHQLRNKVPNSYNAIDKRLLDVIETYENKLVQLENQLTFFSNLGFSLPNDSGPLLVTETNNSCRINNQKTELRDEYKQLIKNLQEEIEKIGQEKELWVEKYELMKLESDSKPSMTEMRDVLNKLKEYKRVLEIHNINPEKEKKLRHTIRGKNKDSKEYPNSLQDIEFLPLKTCQRYLVDFCNFLNTKSITVAFDKISDLLKINALYPTCFGIASHFLHLLGTPGLDKSMKPLKTQSLSIKDIVDNQYTQIIDVLDIWVDQLCSINHLLSSINHLRSILLPWKSSISTLRSGFFGVIDIVDEMIDQCMTMTNSDEKIVLTPGQAKGLVEHFQNLYDCPNSIGVYSRMNVVYSKLTEMQNVIDSVKKILKIDDQKGLACIVAEVDALDQFVKSMDEIKIDNSELTKDIEVLIEKLENYEKFLPEFEELVDKIIDLLGLSSIDEILPRIKTLQDYVCINQ